MLSAFHITPFFDYKLFGLKGKGFLLSPNFFIACYINSQGCLNNITELLFAQRELTD